MQISRDLKVALIAVLCCSTIATLLAWQLAAAEVAELRAKVDGLQSNVSGCDSRLRSLSGEVDSLRYRVGDVEDKIER